MAPRSKPTAELAAFLKRFARRTDSGMRTWIRSLRTGSERTLFGAWLACTDGEAMIYALGADLRKEDEDRGSEAHRRLVSTACACARLALVHVPLDEPRVAQALEIVERWARGDPSADPEEAERIAEAAHWATQNAGWAVRNAVWAARDAAWAAGGAGGAAWAAQSLARVVWHVGWAARRAALAQGASEAEADAAYADMLPQCAELIRREFPRPPYRDPIAGLEDEATYWLQIIDDPSIDPAARQAAGARVLEIEAEIQGG